MKTANLTFTGVLAIAIALTTLFAPGPAAAQSGREPLACMNLALDYAVQLVSTEGVEELTAAQREVLESLNAIAADGDEPASARLEAARSLLGSREKRDLERAVRSVERTHDNARSIVAGWRGLYCPVATPDGGRGLEGQERCDALAATFVDRLRIDQRTPQQTRAREALETERQTIQKLRITRSDRNDLLDLWRLRSETFDALYRLERFQSLQSEARTLIEGIRGEGCAQLGQS
ncbi:MAG TPA: hypothetical protein VLQ65_13285 [Saliniramus sp.]|nr:hypothetical protein [Saliniramus sp.]